MIKSYMNMLMSAILALLLVPSLASAQCTTVSTTILDFESAATSATFNFFGNPASISGGIAPNPNNGGNAALELVYVQPGSWCFEGAASNTGGAPLTTILDFTTGTEVCFDYYEPNAAGSVLFKLENITDGNDQWEYRVTTAMGWNTYCIPATALSVGGPMAGVSLEGRTFDVVVVFPELWCGGTPSGQDGTYYFDNVITNAAAGTTVPPYCDYPSVPGKCLYVLELTDSAADGWDGASIDVTISEGETETYKMAPADGCNLYIPIYAMDGEIIDLAYWNGANEEEHGFTLYTPSEDIANDVNGNAVDYTDTPPVGALRVKADCPQAPCEGETLDVVLRIDFRVSPLLQFLNANEIFWEIRDQSGAVIYGVNPGDYSGQGNGSRVEENITLNKCETYTFVAGDVGGAFDFWNNNVFSFLVDRGLGYGKPFSDTQMLLASDRPRDSGSAPIQANGMAMYDLTIPCLPEIPASDVKLLTGNGTCTLDNSAVTLPLTTPVICEIGKCHVNCTSPAMTVDVFINSTQVGTYNYDKPGVFSGADIVNGNLVVDLSAGFPVGKHTLRYMVTYNCETFQNLVMVSNSIPLIISQDDNPSMTCNDLVHVSLLPGGDDCRLVIDPDDVLENTNLCTGEYSIEITETGTNWVDASYCGQTLEYVVTHCYSGNQC